MRHEAYKITQLMDWFKALVFALITLRQSSKGSSVCNSSVLPVSGPLSCGHSHLEVGQGGGDFLRVVTVEVTI